MSTVSKLASWVAPAIVIAAVAGCVSRDEYLRTDFARRKALERAETLDRDLSDERNRSLAVETERDSLRRELDAKNAESETLKTENTWLAEHMDKVQGQLDDMLARHIGDVEVVEVKLPAELDRALKAFVKNHPEEIEYDPQRGAVRWKSDLTFAKGSDSVRESARAALAEFAEIVNSEAASQFEVIVVGHTDKLPIGPVTARKHPTNWHLSVHRAVSVMFALHQNGVGYERMGCMGYGEFHPREPNPARGGNEANRRVEIFLVGGRNAVGNIDTP